MSTPGFSKTYASTGALSEDINLFEEGEKQIPVRLRIGIGGTLHVGYFDGKEDTIAYQSGDVEEAQFKTIKADGSSAQMITVYW